jgi:hypothetical protein
MEGEGYGASVWKIPELHGQSNSPPLEQLFTLDEHTGKIRWCALLFLLMFCARLFWCRLVLLL